LIIKNEVSDDQDRDGTTENTKRPYFIRSILW
jgi:hypothetical protein